MSEPRTPDEILADFDQAQVALDHDDLHFGDGTSSYNLHDLMWEVLDAVVWVARDTARQMAPHEHGRHMADSIEDFLVNNFGED